MTITYFYLVMAVCAASAAALRATGPARGRILLAATMASAISMMIGSASNVRQTQVGATFNDAHVRIGEALRNTGLGPRASVLCEGAGIIPYLSRFRQIDRVGLADNYLSGRKPISPEQREEYIWQRFPDVYIGYEPPAPKGRQDIGDDERTYPRYVHRLITHKRVTIEDRTFAATPGLLHRRMAKLRDEWVCVGAVNWLVGSYGGLSICCTSAAIRNTQMSWSKSWPARPMSAGIHHRSLKVSNEAGEWVLWESKGGPSQPAIHNWQPRCRRA